MGEVVVKTHDKARLEQGIEAFKKIDKNDKDYANYTKMKNELQRRAHSEVWLNSTD
ncbi:hypothetical protein IV43_GL000986 [Ligilactobacillus acidipiscis]|uniref:Uncharacterized protein n=1 Tax=Ligilactobacillus acidipiscis TaxID=89059 RepID=A0A0R2JGU5_9LACO|nr:hypothetical protein [Ligilactobacillus acidipiscis]KRN74405.1 hypothetical protein IV43_GL000986 [Ligilactobacillus acidipiscis]